MILAFKRLQVFDAKDSIENLVEYLKRVVEVFLTCFISVVFPLRDLKGQAFSKILTYRHISHLLYYTFICSFFC